MCILKESNAEFLSLSKCHLFGTMMNIQFTFTFALNEIFLIKKA